MGWTGLVGVLAICGTVATAWGGIPATPPTPAALLTVSTYFGGPGSDQGNFVAGAPDGGVFATGFLTQPGGSHNGFVAEYSAAGAVDWISTIPGDTTPYYIRDDAAAVYVVGVTRNRSLPGATNTDPTAKPTAFITVLDPGTGAIRSSRYLGPRGFSAANVDAIDPNTGNVFVADSTGTQTIVEELDPTATTVLWSTFLGGAKFITHPFGMAADSAGNVVVTTLTSSPIYPMFNAQQALYGGGQDTGVTEYSSTGTMLWSTYFGGSKEDRPNGVDVDAAGNIYVAGRVWSADMPTLNALFTSNSAATAGYVAEYSIAGVLLYSTYIGGENGDSYLGGIAVQPDGTAWILGGSTDTLLPVVGGGTGPVSGKDGYIAEIEPDDAGLRFASYLGGTLTDGGSSPALSSAGLWSIGRSNSTDFPVTAGAAQSTLAGNYDATLSLFVPQS
jgi:hypothetical protein